MNIVTADPFEITSFNDLSLVWDLKTFDSMYKSWWTQLCEENKSTTLKRIFSPRIIPFHIIEPEIVELIFTISITLKQSAQCRFLAVELFDSFLARHYMELHNTIFNDDTSRNSIKRWEHVVNRVKEQSLLRVMSCIQLASKAAGQSQTMLRPSIIAYYLSKVKRRYSVESVINSERRVFATLDFKVPLSTNLNYVQHFIQSLQGTVKDCDELHDACLSVLEVVYISHQKVYKRLFHMTTARWSPTEKERKSMLRVECDNMLMASSIVASAVTLIGDNTLVVLAKLSALTELPVQDIEGLASIIVEIILSE